MHDTGTRIFPCLCHSEQNLDVWGFTLDRKDMDTIKAQNIGPNEIINHYPLCTAKVLNATRIP